MNEMRCEILSGGGTRRGIGFVFAWRCEEHVISSECGVVFQPLTLVCPQDLISGSGTTPLGLIQPSHSRGLPG